MAMYSKNEARLTTKMEQMSIDLHKKSAAPFFNLMSAIELYIIRKRILYEESIE